MKIPYTLALMICLSTTMLNSQSILLDIFDSNSCQGDYIEYGFTVSGQVLEQGTGGPVKYANVALYKNGVLIQATEADLEGNYSLENIPIGVYAIEFSFLGYQSKRKKNVIVSQDIFGFDIKLEEEKISASSFMNCNTVVLSNLSETKSKKKEHYTISGQILDQITEEPIMFASVALYTKEGILLAGAETDLEGRYSIKNVQKGEYFVEPSFIGYHPKKIIGLVINRNVSRLNFRIAKRDPNTYPSIFTHCFKYSKKTNETTTPSIKKTIETLHSLSGQVLDEDTKEPIMFGSVALYSKEGVLLTGAETNLEGRYIINNIPQGEYHIEPSFIGYQPTRISGILVEKDMPDLDIEIREGIITTGCWCFGFDKPLIKQDDTTSGMILTAEDIRPTYSLNYRRLSTTKKKRIKTKKRMKKKENLKEEAAATIAPKVIAVQEVEVKKEAIDIHMYPNPTSGQVYIKASTEIEKVDVLNMEGKLIMSIPFAKDSGIDLTQLPAATYFLRFHHKNGVQVEKLVVLDSQ